MQAQASQRIAGFIFSVIAPGLLALLIPHLPPTVGWPLLVASVGVGVALLLHAQFAANRRMKVLPLALMAVGLLVFAAGAAWNAWPQAKPPAVPSSKGNQAAPTDAPPKQSTPAQPPVPELPPIGKPVAYQPEEATPGTISPSAPAMSVGRLVIDQPLFAPAHNDPTKMATHIRVENKGLGIAYAGSAYSNYAFVNSNGDLNLSEIIAEQIRRARSARPSRTVEIDAGTSFVFPTSVKIEKANFDEMTSKSKRLIFVEAYAYYSKGTPDDHVEIALLAMVISGLTDSTWTMSIEQQSTKTYRQTTP